MPGVDVAVCLGNLLKRVTSIDHRFEFSGLSQSGEEHIQSEQPPGSGQPANSWMILVQTSSWVRPTHLIVISACLV